MESAMLHWDVSVLRSRSFHCELHPSPIQLAESLNTPHLSSQGLFKGCGTVAFYCEGQIESRKKIQPKHKTSEESHRNEHGTHLLSKCDITNIKAKDQAHVA